MTQWMAIVKTRTTNILCLCSSIVFFIVESKKKNKEKARNKETNINKMKQERERKTKNNLILSYVNLTF
jgi:hypothetical protein